MLFLRLLPLDGPSQRGSEWKVWWEMEWCYQCHGIDIVCVFKCCIKFCCWHPTDIWKTAFIVPCCIAVRVLSFVFCVPRTLRDCNGNATKFAIRFPLSHLIPDPFPDSCGRKILWKSTNFPMVLKFTYLNESTSFLCFQCCLGTLEFLQIALCFENTWGQLPRMRSMRNSCPPSPALCPSFFFFL